MKKAVLLIHGFVGSLYDNEYLMNYLELDKKFDVFAYTLPGHHPCYDYQKVGYETWPKFMESRIQELINYGYKEIYLIGHSMGGVLAGILSTKFKEVKKVVFLNAAFTYLNFKQNKVDILTNREYKDYVEVFDRVFHTSIPFFLEFVKLVKTHHDYLKNIDKDALILQSNKDQVVPIENGIEIFDNIKSTNKCLTYIENGRHAVFEGNEIDDDRKKEIAEYIRLFLRGGRKWKMIKNDKI